jgi:hypothetical protein
LPLVGFKCPSNGEQPGRENTFDYCLTACQQRCMPKAVLVKLRDGNVHNVHKGDMITPSALKGCTRKLVLERTSDYFEEPEKLYYAVRGSLIHGFLEDHGLNNVQTEVRLFKELDIDGRKIVISGQLDYYDEGERAIEDYKTLSDKGTFFLFDTGAKEEHILQTNTYRWLADGGHVGSLDGPQVFWPVDKIKINYLFMNRVVITGTTHVERVTSYKSPNYGKKYRLETRRRQVDKSPRGVPVWEIEIAIPEVPLMPESEIKEHIFWGAAALHSGFRAQAEGGIPPGILYESEEAWQCGFCPVKRKCHDYEQAHNTVQYVEFHNKKKTDKE